MQIFSLSRSLLLMTDQYHKAVTSLTSHSSLSLNSKQSLIHLVELEPLHKCLASYMSVLACLHECACMAASSHNKCCLSCCIDLAGIYAAAALTVPLICAFSVRPCIDDCSHLFLNLQATISKHPTSSTPLCSWLPLSLATATRHLLLPMGLSPNTHLAYHDSQRTAAGRRHEEGGAKSQNAYTAVARQLGASKSAARPVHQRQFCICVQRKLAAGLLFAHICQVGR